MRRAAHMPTSRLSMSAGSRAFLCREILHRVTVLTSTETPPALDARSPELNDLHWLNQKGSLQVFATHSKSREPATTSARRSAGFRSHVENRLSDQFAQSDTLPAPHRRSAF